MAQIPLSDLAKELRKSPSPIYLVVGEETLLVDRALEQIREAFVGEEKDNFACTEIDAQSPPEGFRLEKALAMLRARSLFGGRRVLVLRRADSYVSSGRKKAVDPALEAYFKAPSKRNVLVLTVSRLPGKPPASALLVKCDPPSEKQLPQWIIEECKRAFGKRLDRPAAQALLDSVGPNLQMLVHELDKLSLYVGQRARITAKDVETLVGRSREIGVFELCSAVALRDARKALTLFRQMTERMADREITQLVPAVAWQFRTLLAMRRLSEAGVPMARRMEILGIRSQYRARYIEKDAKRFTAREITELYQKLLDLDTSLKSSALPPRQCFETFLLEACLGSRPGKPRS